MRTSVEHEVLSREWVCRGVPGRPSNLLSPGGRPMMIGAIPCGARIPVRYLRDKTENVNGILMCKSCASKLHGEAESDTLKGTAHEMHVDPSEVKDLRRWSADVRKEHETNIQGEVGPYETDRLNDMLSGRKSYPVEGSAVCSNPADYGKPLKEKVAQRFRENAPEQFTLNKVYKEPVV